MEEPRTENLIIIGSGPAAHSAAIYAARADLEPLMFEGFMAGGVAAGGQLTTTTEVENYPGFPEGISGPDLMDKMRDQSTRYGTRIETETVDRVDLSEPPHRVYVRDREYQARAVIIATGATAKRLNLPGEKEYWQKGISACAVCDGALPIFRDKPLVVIGGGDTAAEESTFLTKFASKVYVLHRRDELRASKAMQARMFANEKLEILWSTVATAVEGELFLTKVKTKNVKTGETGELAASGLFYAIGHKPNTEFLGGQLETDEAGYLVMPQPGSTRTRIAGVFACGDVQDKVFRQAVTAAGSGCMAALEAERYLSEAS
jgi:thioredoxin reductase (NADPH)